MKISGIIPTKNRREYLIDILNDIDNQIYPVLEVVAPDQSENFKEIEDNYNFRLIHFAHAGKGPCISRNDAAEKAKDRSAYMPGAVHCGLPAFFPLFQKRFQRMEQNRGQSNRYQ